MIQHDVLIVGAGLAGMRAAVEAAASRRRRRPGRQGPSRSQPHLLRPGRHQRGPGRRRLLGSAHVRHRQGVGLPGRPGRHRGDVQGRAARHTGAGAHGLPVQPLRERTHRPAPLRRRRLSAYRLRRRHQRLRPAAHHVRADRAPRAEGLRGVVRHAAGRAGRPLRRGRRHRPAHRPSPRHERGGRRARHRTRQPLLREQLQLGRLHRRRHGHGLRPRPAAHGHGVRPVPPHRPAQRRAHHGGLPRRGRRAAQLQRRALHVRVRAHQDGARQPGRGLAGRGDGDRGRARHRRLHPPRPAAHRRRADPHQPAPGTGAEHGDRRCGPLRGAHPHPSHAALLHGRREGGRRTAPRRCRGCSPPAR